jgi:hypothetical protein
VLQSEETGRLPGNPKAWLAAIIICGLTIVVAAGWSSYRYGNGLSGYVSTPVLGSIFIVAFLAMLFRWLATLFFRWRGREVDLPTPGVWLSVWVAIQLACLLAVLTLGALVLLALAIGHAERMFQGLILVLVYSAALFLIGGAVRDASHLLRLLRR